MWCLYWNHLTHQITLLFKPIFGSCGPTLTFLKWLQPQMNGFNHTLFCYLNFFLFGRYEKRAFEQQFFWAPEEFSKIKKQKVFLIQQQSPYSLNRCPKQKLTLPFVLILVPFLFSFLVTYGPCVILLRIRPVLRCCLIFGYLF